MSAPRTARTPIPAQPADVAKAPPGRRESFTAGLHGGGPLYRLAHGELSADDAAELRGLKTQIQQTMGFQCDGYKEKCLRRRIAVRMRARGVHGFGAYAALLADDPQEHARLLEVVTINVSKFFRNAEVWSKLRTEVLPALFAMATPAIRIWSAGCAAGEEVYSLAMVLLEYADEHRLDVRRFRILGTDIDELTLAAARRGEYTDFAFSETSPERRERWFDGPQRNRVRAEVRRLVRFAPLDLIAHPFPENQHLIVCRNVVIYFERTVQEGVFRRFHDALLPGGYLLLGKVEALFGRTAPLFHALSNRERLFRKP